MSQEKYTIDDYIREYKGPFSTEYETYIGIEFKYKGTNYRLSHEIGYTDDKFYFLKYEIKKTKSNGLSFDREFHILNIYDTFDDLLKAKLIDNKTLKEIFEDDTTEILSQD